MISDVREFKQSVQKKYGRYFPLAFFVLGFCFDAVMLHRIDEPLVLGQQAIYLVLSFLLIGYDFVHEGSEASTTSESGVSLGRWDQAREGFLHFLLGTLLNSYTIFYFKSASTFTSLVFITLLVSLLYINEVRPFGGSRTQMRMGLWSLCLISYLVTLVPIGLGFLGDGPFLLAWASAISIGALGFLAFNRWWIKDPARLHRRYTGPFVLIQAVFGILYFLRVIPPVPLSITYMGVFHQIKKVDDGYELSYTRPMWKFWQKGDQSFEARPGDSLYCFAQIFSPSGFRDELVVRWLYKDPRTGWQSSDAIPLSIHGGREEGFRGFTRKSNYLPGSWRVQVETQDGRELGHIGFEVTISSDTEPADIKTITK